MYSWPSSLVAMAASLVIMGGVLNARDWGCSTNGLPEPRCTTKRASSAVQFAPATGVTESKRML